MVSDINKGTTSSKLVSLDEECEGVSNAGVGDEGGVVVVSMWVVYVVQVLCLVVASTNVCEKWNAWMFIE